MTKASLKAALEKWLGVGMTELPDGSTPQFMKLAYHSPTGQLLFTISIYEVADDRWKAGGVSSVFPVSMPELLAFGRTETPRPPESPAETLARTHRHYPKVPPKGA